MSNLFHVLALDDHPDGNAYVSERMSIVTPSPMKDDNYAQLFRSALKFLASHDHVLLVDDEAVRSQPNDFLSLAPYSIHITKGARA